jgi:hypothetical protein
MTGWFPPDCGFELNSDRMSQFEKLLFKQTQIIVLQPFDEKFIGGGQTQPVFLKCQDFQRVDPHPVTVIRNGFLDLRFDLRPEFIHGF